MTSHDALRLPAAASAKTLVKRAIGRVPLLGGTARRIYSRLLAWRAKRRPFAGSATYWETRYSAGFDSGVGSRGFLAEFKAEVLNDFVVTHGVQSVLELGCGDGNQLILANYPHYLGFDVSATAVAKCRASFGSDPTKSFRLMGDYRGERAELVLSLDVIYHLVEDDVFDTYMRTLFDAATRYVVIYSSNHDDASGLAGPHVRHRGFTEWVSVNRRDWRLAKRVPNRYPYRGDTRSGSFSDFFFYERDVTRPSP